MLNQSPKVTIFSYAQKALLLRNQGTTAIILRFVYSLQHHSPSKIIWSWVFQWVELNIWHLNLPDQKYRMWKPRCTCIFIFFYVSVCIILVATVTILGKAINTVLFESLESQPSKAKCKPLSPTALFWCRVLLLWGHLGSDETGGKLKVLFATEMTRERTVYQEKKLKFLSWPTFGASILPKAAWSCLLPMKDRTNNPLCTSGCGCALGVPALLPEPSSLVSPSWLPELLHSILAHLVNSVGF